MAESSAPIQHPVTASLEALVDLRVRIVAVQHVYAASLHGQAQARGQVGT